MRRRLGDAGDRPGITKEMAMSPLRQRMIDAMQLRGMADRTQQGYVRAVIGLSRHYGCSPDQLDSERVQSYLLHLIRERGLSRSSVNQAGCAFRFLYGTVLGTQHRVEVPLGRAEQRLPEILSRVELARLFDCAPAGKPRTVLMTAYALGLRVGELCQLRSRDIDGHADRMCVHIVQGKGAKDRYVPLAADTLQMLRSWWSSTRRCQWLFCSQSDHSLPLYEDSASRWFYAARAQAGICKRGGIHTLRHCYATHLLESGVDLHTLSRWLGHRHVSTTMRYLHIARPDAPDGMRTAPLQLLSALPDPASR
jgi:integrase/recombinase XerD